MKRTIPGLLLALALAGGCGEQAETPEAPDAAPPAAQTAAPGATDAAPGATGAAPADKSATAAPAKVDEKDLKSTPSGLKYAILKPGTGPVAEHQPVTVHYTGWLENGEKFDSSVDRNEPFTFELGHGGVIPGWDEGVKGMKVGEKRRLVVPPALGYGAQDQGKIPPNSTLIFDVELLKVSEGHSH